MHLIPREPNKGGEKVSFALPNDGISDANVQIINSYQVEGSGGSQIVIVDMIRSDARHVKTTSSQPWPWADTKEKYSSSTSKKSLWRYTIQRNTLGLPTIQRECLYDSNISFGVINSRFSGKRHRFVYANVGRMMGSMNPSPPQGIIKMDCNLKKVVGVWMPSINEFCGEPMYAPRTMKDGDQSSSNINADLEDDGYILSILYNGNAKRSEMVVLDAKNISAGPIARIPLGFTVPHGLFGTFVSSEEASWSPDEIERRAKLADKVESRGNLWNEVKSDFSGLGLRLDDFEEYFGDVL
jgi:all-trans-8'-apo-beta-carotenal 15,15'-oxygenase